MIFDFPVFFMGLFLVEKDVVWVILDEVDLVFEEGVGLEFGLLLFGGEVGYFWFGDVFLLVFPPFFFLVF